MAAQQIHLVAQAGKVLPTVFRVGVHPAQAAIRHQASTPTHPVAWAAPLLLPSQPLLGTQILVATQEALLALADVAELYLSTRQKFTKGTAAVAVVVVAIHGSRPCLLLLRVGLFSQLLWALAALAH